MMALPIQPLKKESMGNYHQHRTGNSNNAVPAVYAVQSWGSNSHSTNRSYNTNDNNVGVGSNTIPIVIVDSETNEVSLGIIDTAFGSNSDLYNDILGISASANMQQIQDAYFERRNELFHTLAQIDNMATNTTDIAWRDQYRFETEKKLDAIVGAVRILRDPELRLQYDEIRKQRLLRKQQGGLSQHNRSFSTPRSDNSTNLNRSRTHDGAGGTVSRLQHGVNAVPHLHRIITPPRVSSKVDSGNNSQSPSVHQQHLPDHLQPTILTPGSPHSQRSNSKREKGDAIVRDSNYVDALMRANSMSNYPAPPQLPNYLDSTTPNVGLPYANNYNDSSIVSGLTNPTALTTASLTYSVSPLPTTTPGVLKPQIGLRSDHHRRSSDYTSSTNGESIEETIVSNSTMALNSYGPGPSFQHDSHDISNNQSLNMSKVPRSPSYKDNSLLNTSSHVSRKQQKELNVVTPPATKQRKTLPSSTIAVQKSKLKSSEEQQEERRVRNQQRWNNRQTEINNSIISQESTNDESTVSTYNDDLNDTATYTEASFGATDYDDDYDDDEISLSETLVQRHKEVAENKAGFLDRIGLEIMGVIDDTSRSFEQIFSAFTLRPTEIDAVAGRIDKAKRQMSKTIKRGGLPGLKASGSSLSQQDGVKTSSSYNCTVNARSASFASSQRSVSAPKRASHDVEQRNVQGTERAGSNTRSKKIDSPPPLKKESSKGHNNSKTSKSSKVETKTKGTSTSKSKSQVKPRHSGHV